MEPVKPGEGLVLAAVDTGIALDAVRLNRDGKSWGTGVMSRLQAGQNYRRYVAAAGRYPWRELQPFNGLRYLLKNDKELDFQVDAGGITYPGTCCSVRCRGGARISVARTATRNCPRR